MAWIEEYSVWSRLGNRAIEGLTAKQVEAYLALDNEVSEEQAYNRAVRSAGENGTRPARS
jgi:hypothetical protein